MPNASCRLRSQQRRPVPTAATPSTASPCSASSDVLNLLELHRDRVIAPGIVHAVAAVGGQRHVGPDPPRGLLELPDLVAQLRREEKEALHPLIVAS